jgi:hypothetical protein
MFVGKAGAYLRVEQLKCTFTWVGSWPFLQTLHKDGKAWQGQTLKQHWPLDSYYKTFYSYNKMTCYA